MKKILMVLANENFRDAEYLVPRAFWEQKGIKVETTAEKLISVGRFGYEVYHKILLSEVEVSEYDGIFFVGGSGALQYEDNSIASALAMDFLKSGKAVGAICIMPRIFLGWDILKGKNCTGWNGDSAFSGLCQKFGAEFLDRPVVVDGKILTANGPSASEECALAFAELL